jgi:hypothetical protein
MKQDGTFKCIHLILIRGHYECKFPMESSHTEEQENRGNVREDRDDIFPTQHLLKGHISHRICSLPIHCHSHLSWKTHLLPNSTLSIFSHHLHIVPGPRVSCSVTLFFELFSATYALPLGSIYNQNGLLKRATSSCDIQKG